MVLISLSVQTALRGRREARLERQLAQAEWLCEGGVIRAVQHCKSLASIQAKLGIPSWSWNRFRSAVVEIKVEREKANLASAGDTKAEIDESKTEDSASSAWTVQVIARLDSTSDFDGPMQRSLTLTVNQSQAANINSEKSE